jgi:hypothetical protein
MLEPKVALGLEADHMRQLLLITKRIQISIELLRSPESTGIGWIL